MAPNFYIAFSVPSQTSASDLATPMRCHTGFFEQLIAKIDYTNSTDVFKCGVRDNIHCHCSKNQVILSQNVRNMQKIGEIDFRITNLTKMYKL